MIKRVGLFLQKILKNEYGDVYEGDVTKKDPKAAMKERNPRLAHLTSAQALEALKKELKAYADGDDPFDREFRAGETTRAWWVAVQKKQFGQVLGVIILFR
jgi:O6-methylguanine-DNA--protein-cysteine methyltransferase